MSEHLGLFAVVATVIIAVAITAILVARWWRRRRSMPMVARDHVLDMYGVHLGMPRIAGEPDEAYRERMIAVMMRVRS